MGGTREVIGGQDGEFAAYVAAPASNAHGAAVVLQEMFGVNAFMRQVSDALAAEGYWAACPDLYWRMNPGVELSDGSDAEIERGLALRGALDREAALRDVADTCRYSRTRIGETGKVAAIGFCLGGLLAYLAVARGLVDCGVSYYGSDLHGYLDLRDSIARPLLLHVPDRDRTAPGDAAAKIVGAFEGHRYVNVHVCQGLDHAFARIGTKYFSYIPDAAQLANRRTSEFLRPQLRECTADVV
jgi:carboxymethylenebutenolidase